MNSYTAVCPIQVGRAPEVARLTASANRRTATLIAGEAGVGKSRFAAEAVRLANGRGLSVLVGQCSIETKVPFAPFVTALRRRTRVLDENDLITLFEGSPRIAAALLPETARLVALPDELPGQEDLFAGVWQLFKRLAAPNGGLLLIEDLHWADSDSLRLLLYLARELADLPLWIVGTYRSDELHRRHPLTSVLGELARDRLFEEIRLSPLGREEVREMVSAIFEDTTVGDEFVDAVVGRTGGNPFFVEELVKVLVERGDIYREEGDWSRKELAEIEMPLSVRDTLLARTRDLDASAMEVLELAALAGEELDVPVLAEVTRMDAASIDDVVQEGIRLQLLAEHRDRAEGRYAFRHALTREALGDEIVGPSRQRAHHRLADAIATVHATDLDAVASELADHYAEAGEREEAVEFGLRAARRAAASLAFEEAGRRYERTLRFVTKDGDERLELLVEAATALSAAFNRRMSVAFATEARNLARERSDRIAEARAIRVLDIDAWVAGDSPRALLLAREAAELVEGRDDNEEALNLARLARLLALADRQEDAADLLPKTIELATRASNYNALSNAHGTRMMLSLFGTEFEDSYRAAVKAARQGGDLDSEITCTSNAGYIGMWCGRFADSRQAFEHAIELAKTHPAYLGREVYAEAGYAWLLALCGEFDKAVELADPFRQSGGIVTSIVALTSLHEVAEQRGDNDAGEIAEELWSIAERTGESQRLVPALAARARHAVISQGLEIAAPMFWDVLTQTTTSRGGGSHWSFSPDFASALAEANRLDELALGQVGQLPHRCRSPSAQRGGSRLRAAPSTAQPSGTCRRLAASFSKQRPRTGRCRVRSGRCNRSSALLQPSGA